MVMPPTVEEFDLFSVLVDPWGLTFGFYTYRYRGQAELFVRRDDGEVLASRDAVHPLVSEQASSGSSVRRRSAPCTRRPGCGGPGFGAGGRGRADSATPDAARG